MQDVVSSKYFLSNFKNTAAARTLVAEFLSVTANSVELGSGRTQVFVHLMSLACPTAVEVSGCWSGGAVNGPTIWPGTTTWIVGIADAANSTVYCSGVTWDARSAIPSTATPYALCATANFKKTSAICLQTSLSGMFWDGHRSLNVEEIVSKSGTLCFSLETFAVTGSGRSFLAISVRDIISLSAIVFKIILTSANLARFQMGV